MAVESILIDFQVNTDELTTAQEQLTKTGKVDTKAIDAFNKSIKSTATDTRGLIAEFKKVGTTATQMGKSVENAFGAGITDALDEAGVSVDEFREALEKANTPAKRLETQLRELKNAIALAKVEGRDTGVEFEAMRKKAGELSSAIADAGKNIKNIGSNTSGLDNVIGSISALAGGFAAAQGAAALFGDENEDVQKALLKVNGAMALASGIQQVYNATLKEGALAKLADSTQTGLQTLAQRVYAVAVGTSAGALKAFRVALLATGIGAAIALIILLVQAMQDYGEKTDSAAKVTDNLAAAIEGLNSDLEELQGKISLQGKLQLEALKQRGATDQELHNKTIEFLKFEQEAIQDNNTKRIDALNTALEGIGLFGKGLVKNKKDADDLIKSLKLISDSLPDGNSQKNSVDAVIDATKELAANFKNISEIETDIVIKNEEFKTQTILDGIKKAKAAAEKAAAEAKAIRIKNLQDVVFFLEAELSASQEGSDIELDIKRKLIQAKRDVELAAEGVTAAQAKAIRAKAFKDIEELNKAFVSRMNAIEIQAQIDTNAAVLSNIKLGYDQRLALSIENLQLAAQQEILTAAGNAEKIKAINAKLDAEITAAKNAEIERALAIELAAENRNIANVKRANDNIIADNNRPVQDRIDAIGRIATAQENAIRAEITANERRVQNDEDYVAKKNELNDRLVNLEQDKADRIAEIQAGESEKRKEELINIAATIINVAGMVADVFANLNALQTEAENQRIDEQKRQLAALVEAGAITKKEAETRAKQIEIMERRAKQKQAEREKQQAVFTALLAIPIAFLNGLSQGGPYLGAVYAALAAVQAAIVIARPVPKFFRGKKGNYSGPGEVADMGSEIVERNGRMFLYTKPTQTYLGAGDKVYTATETRNILHNSNAPVVLNAPSAERFDYNKLAKAIPQSSFSVNIDKDFIEESVANGLQKNRMFDKRYKFS